MSRRAGEIASGHRYRTYLVTVLAAIYAFNYFDFQAIGLVLQNIKETFNVSDTDLGLLTGIAFTLFYSTLGVPIGRWADRANRVTVIALTLALRSMMVMLSGAARTFGQLLLVRIGVAVGEAGCMPPALSLIADYFDPAERPRAVGAYLLGFPVSILIGYFAAGWLNELYGWRVMFVFLGAPGLVLVVVAYLTILEPRSRRGRGAVAQAAAPSPPMQAPPVGQVARALWRNRTFRHITAMFCVNYFFGQGAFQWQPAFFIRSFGLNTMQLGVWLSVIFGTTGLVGTYCGGYLASRYAPGNHGIQLRALAILNAAFGVVSVFSYLAGSAFASLALTGVAFLGLSLETGPLFAIVQTVVPDRMVATAIAIAMMMANLIGAGLGPIAVGVMSDAWRHSLGTESLRFALLATCPGFLWGAWHLWVAARTVETDVRAAAGHEQVPAHVNYLCM